MWDQCFRYPRRSRESRDCGCQFALLHRVDITQRQSTVSHQNQCGRKHCNQNTNHLKNLDLTNQAFEVSVLSGLCFGLRTSTKHRNRDAIAIATTSSPSKAFFENNICNNESQTHCSTLTPAHTQGPIILPGVHSHQVGSLVRNNSLRARSFVPSSTSLPHHQIDGCTVHCRLNY